MGKKIALLDTTILIDFFRKSGKTNTRLYSLYEEYSSFCISVVTEYEVFVGANTPEQKDYWEKFLQTTPILSLESRIVQKAIELNEKLKKISMQIESSDLFIAATAICHGLPLATLNLKHFERIKGLKLVA